MLFNEEVSLTEGNRVLINSSLIQIHDGEKYAVFGPNGVGKTTLLNYIYSKTKDTNNVLYVTQIEKIDDECTVYEYMLKSNMSLYNAYILQKNLEEIVNNETEFYSEGILKELRECEDKLKSENFGKYNAKVYKILNGLGFAHKDTKVNLLSGGQHTKLSLAKALILEPSLLLLDEPDNNLDLCNMLWLENYLSKYKKTLIVVSHSINFLDNIAQKILFFFNVDPLNPKVFMCKGDYAVFIQVFEQKRKEYVNEYEKQQKKRQELKKKNTTKSIADLEELDKKHINRPIRDFDIRIEFNKVLYTSNNEYNNVISFNDVSFGYSHEILQHIDIGISMKSRYVLIGDNGSGKTTFFKLCVGELMPTSGEIVHDRGLRIGYFNQNSIAQLKGDMTPVTYLKSINSKLSEQECRSILARVGFKKMYENDPFDVEKLNLENLSGGQKVKLVLCGIQIRNPHVILFDEIENHLDIYSVNEFINAVNSFNGGIIIITHDQYIIENIENYELLILKNNTIEHYNGNFENYLASFDSFDDES